MGDQQNDAHTCITPDGMQELLEATATRMAAHTAVVEPERGAVTYTAVGNTSQCGVGHTHNLRVAMSPGQPASLLTVPSVSADTCEFLGEDG